MKTCKKSVWLILSLIAATSAALVLLGNRGAILATTAPVPEFAAGQIVRLTTELVQDKILIGSNGTFTMAVDLVADEIAQPENRSRQPVDLVVVLDRSGSMDGQKLDDARDAIIRMLDWLSPQDRMALVAYDTGIRTIFPLTILDDQTRSANAAAVRRVMAGGGTNLGGGLRAGIDAVLYAPDNERVRKVILISDGLANHGITDPTALGQMASRAFAQGVAVSTVGVGLDFNETLMTALADNGAGSYYFLENPRTFAAVLEKEFQSARLVAASGLEVRIPLKNGLQVVNAGGYPIRSEGDVAVIQPGDLRSAEHRRIFLTLQLPADSARQITIDSPALRYQHEGRPRTLVSGQRMTLACVADEKAVMASIKADTWGSQVVQEDFGFLKEAVADAIRSGDKSKALGVIQDYEARNQAINSTVGSDKVSENLKHELPVLRQSVEETFQGPPAAVMEKQKKSSKTLQYEGYQSRRDKK